MDKNKFNNLKSLSQIAFDQDLVGRGLIHHLDPNPNILPEFHEILEIDVLKNTIKARVYPKEKQNYVTGKPKEYYLDFKVSLGKIDPKLSIIAANLDTSVGEYQKAYRESLNS